MHTQANDDYVPFGDEWRREMMRWRKADLVEFLRRQLIVLNDLQQEQRGASWLAELEWVIAGPETGPGARECRAEWVEALAAECASSGVPFFDKRRTGWIRRECPAVR
jgi:protein gp37